MRAGLVLVLVCLVGCVGAPQNPTGTAGAPLPSCQIVADGAISAAELPFVVGVSVRYVRNEPGSAVEFELGGASVEGALAWDFSAGPADVGATFETLDPAQSWFGAAFPEATFAAPLAVELPELLGVYRWEPDALGGGELLLLGITTSTPQAPERTTRLVYDEPVVALRLPLRVGDTWGQQATFRGAVLAGVPEAGVEDWHFEVDAIGSAMLPGGVGVDEVLRVRSTLTRSLAVAVGDPHSARYGASFYAPCFGEIAAAFAADPSLSPLDELRRYYP